MTENHLSRYTCKFSRKTCQSEVESTAPTKSPIYFCLTELLSVCKLMTLAGLTVKDIKIQDCIPRRRISSSYNVCL